MRLATALLVLAVTPVVFAQRNPAPKNSDLENIGIRNINNHQINFMSYESEIEMGKQLAADIEKRVTLLSDSEVNGYIDGVAQRIARNSDVQIPVVAKVIQSDDVNSYALPGGFIYVNTGLIRAANNEAELAFVIAHGIAHIAARHGTELASKGELLNTNTIPLLFLGDPGGVAFRQGAPQSSFSIPLTFLSLLRAAVLEADYLGIQYVYKAGYDPAAAITLLQRLQSMEPAASRQLFNTHPPTADRIDAIGENIRLLFPTLPPAARATPEFNAIQARLLKSSP
jgi:predicted Zn-dependent protease